MKNKKCAKNVTSIQNSYIFIITRSVQIHITESQLEKRYQSLTILVNQINFYLESLITTVN